ncbi:hypothetical protein [Haloechinothrix halophila]|uniref:hypothetical protein n=1 Tax=Haloechinothrix halophila TaxID=1069073 RepID=UPI000414367C|nr:hypothetical protein [Haloechinothrix halophila]
MIPLVATLPGVAFGLALTLAIVAVARPAPLHLPAALARLDAHTRPLADPDTEVPGRWEKLLVPLAARATRTTNRWWGIPTTDLDACEITPTGYVARRLAWAAAGAATAAVLLVVATAGGLGPPVLLAPVAVVAGAAVGSAVPVLDVTETARTRRAQFRQAIAAYLDLVAQERAAGAAAGPALVDAASISEAWPFRRLRATLIRAQHAGQPPWDALIELANRMRVPELADVADIAATAADGAAVYTSLTAKAAGLRRATLSADKAAANAASQRLTVPVTLLLVGLLLLVLYPAVIRLLDAT